MCFDSIESNLVVEILVALDTDDVGTSLVSYWRNQSIVRLCLMMLRQQLVRSARRFMPLPSRLTHRYACTTWPDSVTATLIFLVDAFLGLGASKTSLSSSSVLPFVSTKKK
jgi:hypothetical protein